jgi:hypothetical protein
MSDIFDIDAELQAELDGALLESDISSDEDIFAYLELRKELPSEPEVTQYGMFYAMLGR